MGRGPKPTKSKEAKPPVARKSPKDADSRVRDLEKRLEEALKEKAEALNLREEAQEQQAATAEILRVISSSPSDIQFVFDTIVRTAARLCDAFDANLVLADGEEFVQRAHHGPISAPELDARYPLRGTVSGRAILEARIIQVEDLAAATEYPLGSALAQQIGYRTTLIVPLIRDGLALGAIGIRRTEVKPFTDRQITLLQTFADQAVIAIDNVRLFNELQAGNTDLAEALDQQTATAEVLKLISRSAFDLQLVLTTLLENATRLCAAEWGVIFGPDGEVHRMAVVYGAPPEFREFLTRTAIPPGRGSGVGRAALERRTVHVVDVSADPEYESAEFQKIGGYRTVLAVPMLREGVLIGVFSLNRDEVQPFTEKQIQLVTTFANQAVIAIENVRLFNETKEALDRQTATSEILQVISQSPTDVQPVFDAIIASAVRLCDARWGAVFRYDGTLVHVAAHHNFSEEQQAAMALQYPMTPTATHISGRAILTGATVQIPDIALDAQYGSPLATQYGYRSMLAVPILRVRATIGVIVIYRKEPGLFADQHIHLLQTFADQAVIAIENVRLFTELQEKNRALTQAHAQVTESLEQQTATSEILGVISSSPTDVQPVFDTIVQSAQQLCEAEFCLLFQFDGTLLHFVAHHGLPPDWLDAARQAYPMAPGRGSAAARSILNRGIVQIGDVKADPDYIHGPARGNFHYQSIAAVPMLRDGHPIGTIVVARSQAGLFPERQIALVQTFADQAVIAIENVRLFNETKEALERQKATSEILQVISQSPTDVRPVFETIVENAVRLCDGVWGAVFQVEDDRIDLIAHYNIPPEGVEDLRHRYPAPLSANTGSARAARERMVVQISDVESDPTFTEARRRVARMIGFRSQASVPMLRGDQALGVINVYRREAEPFPDQHIELLRTFADQAVIAIENVRLFNETKEALEQQTATADILRVIASSPTELQRVLDAMAESVARLCDAAIGLVGTFDGERIYLRALANFDATGAEAMRRVFPILATRESVLGRTVLTKAIAQIPSMLNDPEYGLNSVAEAAGFRSALGVPMLKDGNVVGAVAVTSPVPRIFADREIALLQTFADQAVIAIEN